MNLGQRYTGLIDKYRDRLPVSDDTRIISLGEGNTPLIRLNNIPRELKSHVDIYVKVRRPQSHRFVQGPGHDHGRDQGGGRGQSRHHLRLDR